nr:MAG TPA: hypothetical protein [Caudoviricetes sp.]
MVLSLRYRSYFLLYRNLETSRFYSSERWAEYTLCLAS